MKIIDVPQGSPEWKAARLGLPTASCFDKIIQPSTGKLSASSGKYLATLLAEWYLGQPLDDFQSPYMVRGTELEAEAIKWYEYDSDTDTQAVGFCLRDDGLAGCSPDRLVGDDGGVEMKVPAIQTHLTYLLDHDTIPARMKLMMDYWCQVQGCLWVTGRKWWDVCSFSPVLPSVRLRIEPEEGFIKAMEEAVTQFVDRLETAKRKLAPYKHDREKALAAIAEESHRF